MLTRFGRYLLTDNRRAYLAALAGTLLPWPGSFIAAIIVGLVTLIKGARAGLIVLAWVALPALALLVWRKVGIFDVALLRAALVWLGAVILLRTVSWRLVLELIATLGVIVIVGVHLLIPNVAQHWQSWITQLVAQTNWLSSLGFSQADINLLIARFAPLATGLITFLFLVGAVVELWLARFWQGLLMPASAKIVIRSEFWHVRASIYWSALVLIASAGLYWHWAILLDIYPVLLLPLSVAGLSAVHWGAQKSRWLQRSLVAVYVLLFLFANIVVPLLALVGLTDSFWDLRYRSIKSKR